MKARTAARTQTQSKNSEVFAASNHFLLLSHSLELAMINAQQKRLGPVGRALAKNLDR